MSSKRKRVKYCNVFRYLQDTDPQLADAISEACAESALNSGPAGLTFLIPTKKSVREELIDGVYGSDPEKVGEKIRALIIPQAIPKLSDFPVGDNKVANRLRQYLDIKKKTADYIELGNGAKIKPFSGFSAWSNRQLVIYELDGEIPTDGPAAERSTARRKGKRGGYSGGNVGLSREELAKTIEQSYMTMLTSGKHDECKCYTRAVCALMFHIKNSHPAELKKALAIFDYCTPATFYLLVEPHTSSNHFIADSVFTSWSMDGFNKTQEICDANGGAEVHLKKILGESGSPISDPTEVRTKIEQMINATTAIDKAALPNKMREMYQQALTPQGVLGAIADLYANCGGWQKKLWQDEFRFRYCAQFMAFKERKLYTPDEFQKMLISMVALMPGTDLLQESTLSDAMYWRKKIFPGKEFETTTLSFFSSTDFLYVYVPPSELAKLNKPVQFVGGDDDSDYDGYDGGDYDDSTIYGGAGCGCANLVAGRAEAFLGGREKKEVDKTTKDMAIELVLCMAETDGDVRSRLQSAFQ